MPKDYTCPCGGMTAKFPGNNRVQVRGGFLFGNQTAIYKCRTRGCNGKVRVGYTLEFVDKDGQVFHVPGETGPGGRTSGKTTARKQTRKRNHPKTEERVSFQFLD